MNIRRYTTFAALMYLSFFAASASAQTTAFTYQGRLTDSSIPANGSYAMQFALFALPSGGTALASQAHPNVAVANGIFTVELDFGNTFNGNDRYLEITVGGTVLLPRQLIRSTPYAIRSSIAGNALNLGGTAASQYVQTTDSRLSDPRTPTANSTFYIQNQSAVAQASSNFNISGNGTAAGVLSGNIVSANTQFSIGGLPVLTNAGNTSNIFVGVTAGSSGSNNSVVGNGAGRFTTGNNNSFFGFAAGGDNTSGSANSFFGLGAGAGNVSGFSNSFFGNNAGISNVGGSSNTAIGTGANVATGNLNFATAIGAQSVVSASNTVVLGRNLDTVRVPGALNVTGTLTASGASLTSLNASNITSGILPIANGGTGSATQNFVDLTTAQTVGGSKTFSSTTRVATGASGAVPLASADLVVEDNAAAFQHFLTPNDSESGILFGDVTDSIAGGIIFNNAATNNGIQFRSGGNTTRMTLDGSGDLGIGTSTPAARLDVSGNIQLTGEVRRPATGTANMLPLAYGHILEDGSAASGSGNFSIIHQQGTGRYDIVVTGENFGVGAPGYTVLVTVMNFPGVTIPATSTAAGNLVIQMRAVDGSTTGSREFSFLIYKP